MLKKISHFIYKESGARLYKTQHHIARDVAIGLRGCSEWCQRRPPPTSPQNMMFCEHVSPKQLTA